MTAEGHCNVKVGGRDLLVLSIEGLKIMRIEGAGTLCLIQREIELFEEAGQAGSFPTALVRCWSSSLEEVAKSGALPLS